MSTDEIPFLEESGNDSEFAEHFNMLVKEHARFRYALIKIADAYGATGLERAGIAREALELR